MATATPKKSNAYEQGVREGRADKSKKVLMEMEKGEGKAHESAESPDEESGEGPEPDDAPRFGSRKRSAKDAKNTKAPMDTECGATPGKQCSACKSGKPCSGRAMKDAGCGGKKMDSALTPYEYLSACDLGIQDRGRSYIRARLDSAERLDLKCGKGSISQGEKCRKGAATKAQGPNAAVQVGQAAKGAGRGVLEVGKWLSGYNIGKGIASGLTGGKNEKASGVQKAAAITASAGVGLVTGGFLTMPLGAARRVGAFGMTDLQQNAKNEKKEKKWRKSVGYKDSVYAPGFTVDYAQLGI